MMAEEHQSPHHTKKEQGLLRDFVGFIREQGVVGLAVGLILGVAAKSLIDSLVGNVFNPVIGLLYGGGEINEKFWCMKSAVVHGQVVCTSKLAYGHFLNDLISFVIVAAVVYLVVKKLHLDKLDKNNK